jgi:branched-chain amino acid transport system permease protein
MKKNYLKKHNKSLIILGVIVLAALLPIFINSTFNLGLLINIIVNAVLAMTFILTLRTGLINMGVAAFWGVGAYVSVFFTMKLHTSVWLSLPASALVTALLAAVIGWVLIGMGKGGLSFVVITSVIGMLFTVVIGSVKSLGGYSGMSYIPVPDPIKLPFLPPIEFTSNVQFYYLALVILLVVILILKALYSSWIGRAWTAIGLTPRLAESIGVNVFRYKLLSFVIASAIAGLIGSYFAHYQTFIMPATFSMWRNIYIQLYAILGGIGYAVTGPLLGSVVMTIFPEFMRGAVLLSQIIIGVILILLILFLPEGLLGLKNWGNFTRLKQSNRFKSWKRFFKDT